MQTILTNGPTSNRLNIVVLSEGYTTNQLAQFLVDATNAVNTLLSHPPYQEYRNYVNAFAIQVASTESGSDHPYYDIYKNTYFNSTYRRLGLHHHHPGRQHRPRQGGRPASDLHAAMSPLDSPGERPSTPAVPTALSKTAIASTGAVAVRQPPAPPGILSHETGHVLANLGDEYATAYPGFPDTEEPNTTQATNRTQIKWEAWISPSTPIPTPDFYGDGVVGLFQGAHYHETGWYRPQLNCAMRSSGVPFCAVCSEALVLAIYQKVRPVDAFSPAQHQSVGHDHPSPGLQFGPAPARHKQSECPVVH